MRTADPYHRWIPFRAAGQVRGLSIIITAMAFALLVNTAAHAQSIQDSLIAEADYCSNTGLCNKGPGSHAAGVDPCFIAQNAMRPCNSSKPQRPAPLSDLNTAGTWEFPLKGGPWVWEIFRDGTYKFHSEAGDGVKPHTGTFSATDGHWSLKATTGYTDSGTYTFQAPDTLIATGQLGTGAWRLAPGTAGNKLAESSPGRKR